MDIRRRLRLRLREDRGETLLELLVSITILGVCVVAFGSSIALAVTTSDQHHKEADAGALVRSYAEQIDSWVAAGNYSPCVVANAYKPSVVGLALPTTYTATQSAGLTIGTTGATSTCTTDNGTQQLTLTVSSTDGRASEQLVVVIRKP